MTPFYKVLVDGASAHGGNLTWSLPTQDEHGEWQPGAWHRLDRPVQRGDVCRRGFHLTTDPMQWPTVGMQVFDAEGEGPSDTGGDKTAFTAARLLRPSDYEVPEYWRRVEQFVRDEIPSVPWLQPDGNPDPSWHLSLATDWSAARSAAERAADRAARSGALGGAYRAARSGALGGAYRAAEGAAYHAAESAAESAAYHAADGAAESAAYHAALVACLEGVCFDLPVEERHRDYARAAWNVWRKGYALYGDVDGVLYVYGVRS